jgi:hypothetical protein
MIPGAEFQGDAKNTVRLTILGNSAPVHEELK